MCTAKVWARTNTDDISGGLIEIVSFSPWYTPSVSLTEGNFSHILIINNNLAPITHKPVGSKLILVLLMANVS